MVEKLNHLLWMTENMPLDSSKYNRWLGFLQGCLYMLELRTIDEMREDNKTGVGLEKVKEILINYKSIVFLKENEKFIKYLDEV